MEFLMTRQHDINAEERESNKRHALVKALEYELPLVLQQQDIMLYGFAVKYDDFECLMTLKADVQGIRSVSFIASDTVINCILKSVKMARSYRLRWKEDVYKVNTA